MTRLKALGVKMRDKHLTNYATFPPWNGSAYLGYTCKDSL